MWLVGGSWWAVHYFYKFSGFGNYDHLKICLGSMKISLRTCLYCMPLDANISLHSLQAGDASNVVDHLEQDSP